jgi:hypothetical protein
MCTFFDLFQTNSKECTLFDQECPILDISPEMGIQESRAGTKRIDTSWTTLLALLCGWRARFLPAIFLDVEGVNLVKIEYVEPVGFSSPSLWSLYSSGSSLQNAEQQRTNKTAGAVRFGD